MLHLEKGQKLSTLDIELTENSTIISPTGSGKTYWVANLSMKMVIVVPRQALLEQIVEEYNAVPFYQFAKEVSNSDRCIVTTDASINRLAEKINISEYTLFIDEAHNFTSSSSPDFKLKSLTQLIEVAPYFKNFYLLTATPLFNLHPTLDLPIIKVTSELAHTKRYVNYYYEDRSLTILDICSQLRKEGEQFAILFNNTKEDGQLGQLLAVLVGFKISLINAGKKNTQQYKDLCILGKLIGDGMISTTVIKEGTGIIEHTKKITVLIIGDFHPSDIEQYSARFRIIEQLTVINLQPIAKVDKITGFKLDYSIENTLEIVKAQKTLLNHCNSSLIGKEIIGLSNRLQEGFFKFKNNVVVEDWLRISNFIFKVETKIANQDNAYMLEYLERFGFVGLPNQYSTDKLSKEAKTAIKETVAVAKENKIKMVNETFDIIKGQTFEENQEVLKTDISKLEGDIRSKVGYIYKYTNNMVEACDKLIEIGLSTRAFNNLVSSILNQEILTNSEFRNHKSSEVYSKVHDIYKLFPVGKIISSLQIQEAINNSLSSYGPKVNKSKTNTTRFLSTFVELTKTSVTVDGKKIQRYKVSGLNPSGLDINTDRDKLSFSGQMSLKLN